MQELLCGKGSEKMRVKTLRKLLKDSLFLDNWLTNHGAYYMGDCRGSKGVRQFAREIGVSPTLISRIEHGKSKMGRPTLAKLLNRKKR